MADIFQERSYRQRFAIPGLQSFTVKYLESDLWVGVSACVDSEGRSVPLSEVEKAVYSHLVSLRREMDAYLAYDPVYRGALAPYEPQDLAPAIFHDMSRVCHRTSIGPMSAVAGAVALNVAEFLRNAYACREVLIENGGDIYADVVSDLDISVFAGHSPLSEKVGLHFPAGRFPLGICTSSGTVGPSLSLGKADAVMIVCRDVLLADSYATAMANRVKNVEDVQRVIDLISGKDDILGAVVIKDDRMGVSGEFELRLFR